ncbi:histidine kinase, partial [Mycobacterium sp. ITM-2017-0098]
RQELDDAEGPVDELDVVATAGDGPEAFMAAVPTAGSVIGDVFTTQTPVRCSSLELSADHRSYGPALVLPVRVTGTVAGVLVALRPQGAPPFSTDDLAMMAAFVDQAALAWQLAKSQRQLREVDVLTDRERIARDLHDHVIQRLFAVGLSLQGTIPRARSAEVQQRLSDCVDD